MSRRVTSPGFRAQRAGVRWTGRSDATAGIRCARAIEMDDLDTDPTLQKAMALALMRQALEWLEAADEDKAAAHLRDAVDTLLKRAPRMDRAAAS